MNRRSPPMVAMVLVTAALVLTGLVLPLRGPRIPLPDVAALPAVADPAVALALEAAADAVRHAPDSASAWGELGLVLAAHGEDDAAVRCFHEAAARDTRSWRWPFYAAATLGRRDPRAALADVDAAVDRDPRGTWPRLLRAEYRAAVGRTDEAADDFEGVTEVEPGNARARLGLARVLVATGAAERGLERLGPARDDPTTRRQARELAAAVAARRGDGPAARSLLAEAAALPPDAAWPDGPFEAELPGHVHGKRAILALVDRLERDGALDRAGALTRRLETEHRDVWLFVEGRLCAKRGDLPAAERAFREAMSLDPGALEARSALAEVLAAQGKAGEAVDELRELLRLEPAHGPSWLALGRLLLPTDRETALDALRAAAAYMPTSDDARRALADVSARPAEEPDRR